MSKIPDGELFADLQQSHADITLMEMLKDESIVSKYKERLSKERKILERIKDIIRIRFSDEQLNSFLDKGYKRQVNLTQVKEVIKNAV